jgi:hypothetical protein
MFAAIKSLIPEPRQAAQPRNYTGRHRQAEVAPVPVPVPVPVQVPQDAPVSPAPVVTKPPEKSETAAA